MTGATVVQDGASTDASAESGSSVLELRSVVGPTDVTIKLEGDGPLLLGRLEHCDLRLDHLAVSREHARFARSGGTWFVSDVGSRHGTTVNGVTVDAGSEVSLAIGDHIQVGPWVLRLTDPAAALPRVTTIEDYGTTLTEVRAVELEDVPLTSRHLDAILTLSGTLAAANKEADIHEAALDAVAGALQFENAAFVLTSPSVGEVDIAAARPMSRTSSMQISQSLIRAASQRGVAAMQARDLTNTPHSIMTLGIHAAVCAEVPVDRVTVGFIYGDWRSVGYEVDERSAQFCAAVARMAGLGIANLRRRRLQERQARLDDELAEARKAQEFLVPRDEGTVGGVPYVLSMTPGRVLTGDLFDIMELPDGRVGFFIGDVAGKGTVASMLMAGAQGRLSAVLEHSGDLAHAIADANAYVAEHSPDSRFVTMFACVVDPVAGKLDVMDCGHGYAVLIGPDGAERLSAPTNLPLGIEPEHVYEGRTVDVATGSRLVLFTDGVVEQQDGSGRAYGIETAMEALSKSDSARGDLDALLASLRDFAGTDRLADDCTAVSVALTTS